MNISQDFIKGVIKDGYDYMFENYDKEALNEVAPQIFGEKKIDGDYWQSTTVIGNGSWRKTTESEPFMARNIKEGYTVYASVFWFTDAISFSKNAKYDLQKIKDIVNEAAKGWGTSAVETREEFYANVFNKGGLTAGYYIFNGTPESHAVTDSSGDLAYDSVPAFNLSDNTRSSKGGGTYYNGHALELTAENLKSIITHGETNNNFYENDATKFNLMFDTLVVPGALRFTASEILNSTLVPYKSTNETNSLQGALKPIVWQYLTDTNAFFVGKAKNGIEMINRQEPQIDFFEDKVNRCYWATAEMRIGVMFKNFRYWQGSNFSTS